MIGNKDNLILKYFIIVVLSLGVQSQTGCSDYPQTPIDCIQNTQNIECKYDNFFGRCVEARQTNLGCSVYLNREACINQLTDQQNNIVYCVFEERCTTISKTLQQSFGCYDNFNKYACMRVENQSCGWDSNNGCRILQETISDNSRLCNIFQTPVNPYTCSSLTTGLCVSNGIEGNFQCIELQQNELSQLSCYEFGLNEESCLSIQKENYYCIFKDKKCIEIELSQVKSCDQKLSKFACLSIENTELQCEWSDQKCKQYQAQTEQDCETINQVNISVCQISSKQCYYDKSQHKCLNIDSKHINNMKCDTPGLSKLACLSIKNYMCTFAQGTCQELSDQDLYRYQCHMSLNKLACLNIKTHFQYCFWNGNNCERRFMNQDYDCPLKLENNNIKVNGNVCQAISKDRTKCKYNQQTNLCVVSSENDSCDTPFINRFGCLSIMKDGETCQWTSSGCNHIQVILFVTKCNSLGSANPIACSQVLEKEENKGCYFDDVKQQCVSLMVEIESTATKTEVLQHYKDLLLLNNISCQDQSKGLNRIACSSITTKNVACKWKGNQCIQVQNKMEIQAIQCLSLKYANYKTCALVQFGNEVCRYNKQIYGCINSFIKNMQCNVIGLNQFGCQQTEGKCQFIDNECQESDYLSQPNNQQDLEGPVISNPTPDTPPTDAPLTCETTNSSKSLCVSLSSTSLLCQWNKAKATCETVEIKQNQKCLDFNGNDVFVNLNVCASIVSDFPDYDFAKGFQVDKSRGYCQYNKLTFQCQIKKELCNTKCCTENENIGINANSCSKFSSNEPGDYCFFMNLKCQELTYEIVDISNESQIKQFYDENQLSCSSMNKNSCHMIGWSVEQLCYYNGIACLNLNYSYYEDFSIFTVEPSILNENACFAINGVINEKNKLKYFLYNYDQKRCQVFQQDTEFPYSSCEDAKGNRNVCQRYTGNNYCRWDITQLKCITIPFDEFDEIITCDLELNVKACTDIKKSSCFFSNQTDQCSNVTDFNVDCNHFNSLGKVSWQVCLQIDKSGQQCEFRDYSCVNSTKVSQSCDGSLANNRSCFKNTRGLCRWDVNTFQCYVNHTDISKLKCTDNINRELCKLITTQACIWNDNSNECKEFTPLISTEFELIDNNGDHKFNELACLQIIGDAYYYDKATSKCLKLNSITVDCNQFQMNKYACLYHTRTHNCYYDELELIPKNKCKQYVEEQTQCETQWQINIEVCMNLYQPCIFDLNTLSCKTFEFQDTMTCSYLQNMSLTFQHPNKRICSSVSQDLVESVGEFQCFDDKQNQQQCRFEKYCFWYNYNCEILKLVYENKESTSGQQQTLKECPNFERVNTCTKDVLQNKSSLYRKDRSSKTYNYWQQSNATCQQHILTFQTEHNYYQISDNLKICQIIDCTIIEEYYCDIRQEILEIVETVYPINSNDYFNISTYKVELNTVADATCENQNCSQLSELNCNIQKSICQLGNQCEIKLIEPFDFVYTNDCKIEKNLIFSNWCLLKENKIKKCSNIYSKAICLELIENCYFDINQGGCRQQQGDEHNINQCSQISNDCNVSSNQNAICKFGTKSIKPGIQCKTVQKDYLSCVPLTTYLSSFSCNSILTLDSQPSLCAKANDECRYSGNTCINSMPNRLSNGKCPCDSSFSKTLCESCGCNYSYLGRCQQSELPPQLNQDSSNKYHLCYQVNILETPFKEKICGSVDQACAYVSDNCQDATHFSCNDLFLYTVSLKACQKCNDYAVKYIDSEKKCHNILNSIETSCDNLNKYACLRNTQGVKCKWQNFNCQTISIQATDQIDCQILNYNACYSRQMNICWMDPLSSFCVSYDPYKGECSLLKTEQLCIRSMYENCKWSSNKCIKNSVIPVNTCDNLNQYQCLHQVNIACGWSDNEEKCVKLEFNLTSSSTCIDFLQPYQQSSIHRTNYYTCTQIKIQEGCIHDQYYKCREVIPTDFLSCVDKSISIINEYACAKLTKGKCQFINNLCQQTIDSKLGCLANLNQEACLNQTAACKFDIYCQPYKISSIQDIRTLFPYTSNVCTSAELVVNSQDGNVEVGIALIYSVAQQKCLDITNKDIKINDCAYLGMNKYSCLLKTNKYCKFELNQCKTVESKEIMSLTTCKPTLNQYSCTRLNIACKFVKGQCTKLNDNDNCISLSKEKSIVNERACLRDSETPCMFNFTSQNCEVITTPQKCPGLNYKGCLFITQGYNCEYKNSRCVTAFGNPNCQDRVNEDKCLSIITKGQYCYFDKKNGCTNIDTKTVDISICYKNELQTNPYTCSRSTDIPCFFDKQSKKCIQYTEQNESSYKQNYSISNIYSLNMLSCQIFNQLKALIWQETCQIVKSSQLVYLKCNALLNKIACLSIKTPFQYCQYKNNKCVQSNLQDFINVECDSIKDVNSGAFCSINDNKDIACQFNKSLFKCEKIEKISNGCVEKDPQEIGLNKYACNFDPDHCVFDENCYRKNNSGYQFCRDINVNSQFQCKEVTNEGCMIQSNICKKIYYQSYNEIKCEQASNKFGCVNIQTLDQYCQFDGSQCKSQDVKQYNLNTCLSIVNINHYSFCEQATDIPCTFDLKNNNCRNVYSQEEFSCERGLNKIACLTQTNKSLMCSFLDYCYGPNNGILNCTYEDTNKCCREANQIDTCLNQKIYQCEWTDNGCQALTNKIDQCDKIIHASFLVCASIKNVLCVYVPQEHKCKIETPTTCGLSQTSQQCKRMKSISCTWNIDDEKCVYQEESTFLSCQTISKLFGNQRACMNVEQQGQMCIYKDEKCSLFSQQENVNNCLDTINKTACLQQTVSDCIWNIQVYRVRKYAQQDEEDILQGQCIPISNLDQISCSSNLSYTTCLKVSKPGQQCIWKEFKCQSLNNKISYTPNSLILINQHACSLINNGDLVRYEESINACVTIRDVNDLTCNPSIPGINKEACLSIKTQTCSWNTVQKICNYLDIIDTTSESCYKPNWTILSCSKLNINQPCGYTIDGCQLVDINIISCTHAGLNKFACLNILKYPCIWKKNDQNENYYCDDYFPFTQCQMVPMNVNPKVCQLVNKDACYFDIQNQKCDNSNLVQATCDTLSLNIIGCIQIDECIFQGFCQKVQKQNYDCDDYPLANYKVCQNALNSCKFNEITFGCTQAYDEQCDSKGLSQQGCKLQDDCEFTDNQCSCIRINRQNCDLITSQDQCNSLKHCILKYDNYCKWKSCEDLIYDSCQGQYISQAYCYLDISLQCKSAKSCQDIKFPLNLCPNIYDKPCIYNPNLQQCELLNCELLNEPQCNQNNKICKFENSCQIIQCQDRKQLDCQNNNCSWNDYLKICENQLDCSKIQTKDQCFNSKYQNEQCFWIESKDQSYCTDKPCKNIKNSVDCTGAHFNQQVCVLLNEICLSCEEISNPCTCLQQQNYCKYDFDLKYCKSLNCSSFLTKEECPLTHCRYKNNCTQQCQFLYNQQQCLQHDCKWGDNNYCVNIVPIDSSEVVIEKGVGDCINYISSVLLMIYL